MPLTYSRWQWSLLLDNGMLLASLGPIDEKWSLKAFDKSDESDIEVPFRFNSLIDKLTALRHVRSWMICHVLRGSPLVSVNLLLYNSLAALISYCKSRPQDTIQQNCSEYSPAPPAPAPMDSPSFHRQACERQVRGTLSRNSKLVTYPFVCLQIPKWAASARA